jgi:hypothetical protein
MYRRGTWLDSRERPAFTLPIGIIRAMLHPFAMLALVFCGLAFIVLSLRAIGSWTVVLKSGEKIKVQSKAEAERIALWHVPAGGRVTQDAASRRYTVV